MCRGSIRIYDIENVPFGTKITVYLNGNREKAVTLNGYIAFEVGNIINLKDKILSNSEYYL